MRRRNVQGANRPHIAALYRHAGRATIGASLTVALTMGAGQAMAAPQPSVSSLINQIAEANQKLANLDDTIASKREDANRALVDLQNARDRQDLAQLAIRGAGDALSQATKAIADAQKRFNDFTRNVYMNGGNNGSLTQYLSSANPEAILDKASVLEQLTQDQQNTIRALKKARNEQANRLSGATASKSLADLAAKSAEGRRSDALKTIQDVASLIKQENERRQNLAKDRDEAQRKLNEMRGTSNKAVAPQDNPVIQQQRAEATANAEAAQTAAQAAGKLALDTTQRVLAGVMGTLTRPHTDTSPTDQNAPATDPAAPAEQQPAPTGQPSAPSPGVPATDPNNTSPSTGGGQQDQQSQPGLRGAAAVEVIVNRALSQLGVTYAWGGGDANGATRGIRDGGVADSYGDFNKVGFDCSGLTIYAFAGIGYALPHYTGYQYNSGPKIPLSQMQRGDMIFWGPGEHVAIYLGNNQMVEAPQSGDVVKISPVRGGAMPFVVRLW